MNHHQNLIYLLSQKEDFLVITFFGALRVENLPIIDQCEKDILQLKAKYCVLNLHDVLEVNMEVLPQLIGFQTKAREHFGVLRLVSLRPSFKNILLERRIVRSEEMKDNLIESWIEFAS